MEVVTYSKDDHVMRYGGISTHACFFILKGSVEAKTPTMHSESFETQRELLEFCRRHYRDIIWEKTPDGIALRD